MNKHSISRREFLKYVMLCTAGAMTFPYHSWAEVLDGFSPQASARNHLKKQIPKTGEYIPIIGMGTWLTFNVKDNLVEQNKRVKVLEKFFDMGGGMIDSSPMYGAAEELLGYGFDQMGVPSSLFSASKIWTLREKDGVDQFNDSLNLWGVPSFDLFQVHNLLNWNDHLKTLRQYKEEGKVRYIGVTTSHGRRHDELYKVMSTQELDFVQLTYNMVDREVEDRLLPLAKDLNIAVIANRPFQGGHLIDRVKPKPLPPWAGEVGIENWAQFLLQFIVSHPAVTCAIPATSRVDHMTENMSTAYGKFVDASTRKRMIEYVEGVY